MTPERKDEITRRARIDATALRCGYPYKACPYHSVEDATLWRKVFDACIAEARK